MRSRVFFLVFTEEGTFKQVDVNKKIIVQKQNTEGMSLCDKKRNIHPDKYNLDAIPFNHSVIND